MFSLINICIDFFLKMTESKASRFKVKVLEKTEEKISVRMDGVDLSIMNAFRRNCIWEVECMSMENLEVFINTSNVEDKVLAHRLGQIPLISMGVKKYLYPADCKCGNVCDLCGVVYTLNVKNVASRDSGIVRDVTTLDLHLENESVRIRPAHTNDSGENDDESIYICSLYPGCELSFKVIARKGTAKDEHHYKYQPVSRVGLKSSSIVKLNQKKLAKLTPENKKRIVAEDQNKIFKYDEKTSLFTVIGDPDDCFKSKQNTRCMELVTAMGQPGAIKIIPRDDYYVITVSSNGCLPPEVILQWAMLQFLNVLEELHRELSMAEFRR